MTTLQVLRIIRTLTNAQLSPEEMEAAKVAGPKSSSARHVSLLREIQNRLVKAGINEN